MLLASLQSQIPVPVNSLRRPCNAHEVRSHSRLTPRSFLGRLPSRWQVTPPTLSGISAAAQGNAADLEAAATLLAEAQELKDSSREAFQAILEPLCAALLLAGVAVEVQGALQCWRTAEAAQAHARHEQSQHVETPRSKNQERHVQTVANDPSPITTPTQALGQHAVGRGSIWALLLFTVTQGLLSKLRTRYVPLDLRCTSAVLQRLQKDTGPLDPHGHCKHQHLRAAELFPGFFRI